MSLVKNAALFVGGVVFGSLGFKLLGSKEARKVYVHTAGTKTSGSRQSSSTSKSVPHRLKKPRSSRTKAKLINNEMHSTARM